MRFSANSTDGRFTRWGFWCKMQAKLRLTKEKDGYIYERNNRKKNIIGKTRAFHDPGGAGGGNGRFGAGGE